jgi:hypothetical protein
MREDKKTNLPLEIASSYRSHEETALRFAEKEDYSSAEREYRVLLSEIMQAQGETIRYHKGGPYNQIGFYLFNQWKTDDAWKYFLYAFIEDCITEDNFPEWAAFKNLYGVYKVSKEDLRKLFDNTKEQAIIDVPLNPERYLQKYFDDGNKISKVSINRDRNVFIGGNYRNIVILRYIEDIVNKEWSAILPTNYGVRNNDEIYNHSMGLLETCGSAIFEITFDAGHLMEIERAKNFIDKENILLLYQQTEKDQKPRYTSMLLGVELKQVGYRQLDELTEKVNDFLKGIKAKNA